MTTTDLRFLVAFVCMSVLVGCATAYQAKSISGGFTETQTSENTFQVYFRGNGYTSEERASDFTLLRSAEVTLEHGFRYFVIVDERASTSYGAYTTPRQTYTTGTANFYGNTAYGSATSTTYGGQTFLIRKPSQRNSIICFKEKPDFPGQIFDANFVGNSIRAKYGMDQRK